MEIAYVIGPYRSREGVFGLKKNIDKAEELAVELWKLGYAVICPHKNTAFFDGILPDEAWLEGDIEILKKCDLAVTVKGWENSSGSRDEVDFCKKNNIPVYFSLEELVEEKCKEK